MVPAALLALLITFTFTAALGNPTPKFPAILAFGDSTVDTGNNNYIFTPFKGNHRPYGHNFPGAVPTGRFSNGRLVPDILASMLGLKDAVPPFLDPLLSDQDIVSGVSFASAGSGYDDLTTSFSRVIPMSRQLDYLNDYVERLHTIVGEREAANILNRALVIVSAGTNDFTFNFYDFPTRRLQFTVSQYQNFLHAKLQSFIKVLYDVGCRKMVVSGLPPIGCLPIQMTVKSPLRRSCCQRENQDAEAYNDKLRKVLSQMEMELAGSRILYADVYNPIINMINNPLKYDFAETTRGCCGTGLLEAGPLCTPLGGICVDPSRYLFWDSIHPTESTYQILSQKLAHTLIPNIS
ncbi:GDSL esterase/lipase At1g06990-like [Salvia miltiorrhiza]|uniref:GDSL esterase/lipase At1g06990-like n=1 Tax=Salvia miltiorrhiza TaxID=226208 RepID=UPI0025AC54C2|nr:GDSL esterase/lipase At1g06990-like [Salvia miltiorrhiza]